jgi:hypothetical protein
VEHLQFSFWAAPSTEKEGPKNERETMTCIDKVIFEFCGDGAVHHCCNSASPPASHAPWVLLIEAPGASNPSKASLEVEA